MSQLYYSSDPIVSLSDGDRTELRKAWISSPAVWRFVPHRGDSAFMRRWLSRQGPAEWHDIATKFNWETTDIAPMLFIAQQPTADRASIMSMVLDQDLPLVEQLRKDAGATQFRNNAPQIAQLLDTIELGFAKGWYARQNYRLSHAQAALVRTRVALETLSHKPQWSLPATAWAPVNGEDNRPEYIWDGAHSCQRLPFQIWARLKLKPH